jgi:ribosomal protein L35AE/L33A
MSIRLYSDHEAAMECKVLLARIILYMKQVQGNFMWAEVHRFTVQIGKVRVTNELSGVAVGYVYKEQDVLATGLEYCS